MKVADARAQKCKRLNVWGIVPGSMVKCSLEQLLPGKAPPAGDSPSWVCFSAFPQPAPPDQCCCFSSKRRRGPAS